MIEEFLKEIEELREAKNLLDEILTGYNIYSKKFEFDNTNRHPTDKLSKALGYQKAEEMKHLWKTNEEELNDKIRAYLKFDDSE